MSALVGTQIVGFLMHILILNPTGITDSLGCYTDVGDSYRALSHRMTPEVPGMTPAICMAYCSDKGRLFCNLNR